MAKRPIFTKAHDAATNNGTAVTNKRVSITDNPLEIFKLTTLYIIIKRMKLRISSFRISVKLDFFEYVRERVQFLSGLKSTRKFVASKVIGFRIFSVGVEISRQPISKGDELINFPGLTDPKEMG